MAVFVDRYAFIRPDSANLRGGAEIEVVFELTLSIVAGSLSHYQATRQHTLAVSLTPPHHLAVYLTQLLYDLEAVEESSFYHPEENALLHSLQAFELAKDSSDNQALIAAALFHDIGKSEALPGHELLGADFLRGLLPDYVVWLVAHHMDLLHDERRTNRALCNTQALRDLKQLRRWDLRARVVNARVCSVEFAVDYVCRGLH